MPCSLTSQHQAIKEAARLAAVAATRLLDTGAEDAFDRMARLAVRQCQAHAAFIALVDEQRVCCKSRVGARPGAALLWPVEWPRSVSLCAGIVTSAQPLALPGEGVLGGLADAAELSLPGIASCAGVPLLLDGHAVGALCVADTVARRWSEDDFSALQDLAAGVATEIALRMTNRRLEYVQHSRDAVVDTLRLAMAAAHVSTFEWDIENDHIAWSDNLEGFLGLVPGTFGGTFDAFMALVHLDDRERVRRALQRAANEGQSYSCNFRMLRADGGVRWTETRGRMVRNEHGQPLRLFGVDVDVTRHQETALAQERERLRLAQALQERERIEHALRDSEARLRLAMQVASTICFEWDIQQDRVQRFVSTEEALQPTGEAVETLEDVVRVVHPEDRAQFRRQVQAALEHPQGLYTSHYRIVRTDGSVRWLHEHGQVEFDGAGRPSRLVGVSHDETQQRQLEQDREHHIALLRDSDRRKDEFLAMLAHELRNPLAPIRNAVRLLESNPTLDPKARQACAIVDRQSAHLSRMVEDLLDVSRIVAGKVALQRAMHDACTLVEASIEMARPLLEARGHQLELQLPSSGRLWVQGDLARLTQALGNVVRNAAKYTPCGGRIEVAVTQADNEWVDICVADNGIGIDATLLPQVFELFVQADALSADGGGGLGIGLALVRKLVELHGGSVAAHSDGLGHGARFTIRLPKAHHALADEPAPPARADTTACDAGRCRVLLVDDNVDASESLAMLLEMEGHEVVRCARGTEGRDRACAERFDVVLLDIGLPDMSGLEVAQAVRAGGASRAAMLIAVSGHGQPEDRARAARAGFDDYQVKPVDMPALLARLKAAQPEITTAVAQRLGDARLHRLLAAWNEVRGISRWAGLQALLTATQDLEPQRVVVAIAESEPGHCQLRILAVGSALAAMCPQPLAGRTLEGLDEDFGTLYAAFAQVARSGEPGHECVEYDFGPGDQLRFERLIVPATDNPAAARPTHLVALVSFDPMP